MTLFALSGLLNFISSFLFGFFVFFKDPKNKIYRYWLAFSLAVAYWEFGVFMIGSTQEPVAALFWWRTAYIGVILLPVFWAQFIYSWLNIKRKYFFYFSWSVGVFYSALNLTDLFFDTRLFIPGVRWIFDSFYYNVPQFIYTIFVVCWFFIVLYAHYELYKIYKVSTGTKRSQIQYFFFAFLVAYSGGATCYLVVYHIDFYPIFNFTAPLYPLIMAYAIVRHRLMDIKIVLRKYSVYLMSLFAIVAGAVGIKYVLDTIISSKFSNLTDSLILIGAISIYPGINRYFYRLANTYFFTSLYDSREVIAAISEKLRTTLDTEKIYDYVYETLAGAFHMKAFGIMTYDPDSKQYFVKYNKGFELNSKRIFPEEKNMQNQYIKKNRPIILEEMKRVRSQVSLSSRGFIKMLESYGVEILAPLNAKDKTIGLIALGAKESGDMYNDEDLQVLEIVGSQAAIALENAILYSETKDFNIKLEAEVERATRDLREMNEKLKKLDQAKSDFISIASHQLRTPLTVIKGYISMMLEGSFGDLTKLERDSLEKVYESNERLIQLVENLLNLSRIESGRLQFNFEKANLCKTTESVIDELFSSAVKKGLKLVYKRPDTTLPDNMMDEEKIRQVVMNFIDNAIKYTKKGTITVSVREKNETVQFCVSDSGMGIDPADLPNLFKRFVRGTGTSLVHTEGTGLGLYVARKMVEAHNGKIWAESAGRDKGSKFHFWLPLEIKTPQPPDHI